MSDSDEIDSMIVELKAAGWTPKTPTLWSSPSGKLFAGPVGAWRHINKDSQAVGPEPGRRECSVNDDLEHAIAKALNRFSAENASNTPDFILAQYLLGCLAAWNQATQQRETWWGRDARPTEPVPGSGFVEPEGNV